MKLNLNAIGFTDKNALKIGEGLIITGLVLAGVGVGLLRESQEWVCGVNKEQLAHFKTIYDSFKE